MLNAFYQCTTIMTLGPKGQLILAQRFIAGTESKKKKSPVRDD
jgi:hypothetical protein